MSPIEAALEQGQVSDISPIAQLWLLRVLVPLGAANELVTNSGFACHRIAKALGLGDLVDVAEEDFVPAVAHNRLGQLHRQFECLERQQPELFKHAPTLTTNIQALSSLVGLKEEEKCILAFVVQLHSSRELDNATDMLGALSSAKLIECLGTIVEIPTELVHQTLNAQAMLARSGLLSIARSSICNMRSKLHLLSNTFADSLLSGVSSPMSLLTGMVKTAEPPKLQLTDYPHIANSLDVLLPFLGKVISDQTKGVNIFIHGASGTGKTQLVKCLAAALGVPLYEVASADEDGDPVSGAYRLRAYRATQRFFSNTQSCIMFDEVDDVFPDEDDDSRRTAQSRKAWINRTLEENALPAFWLSQRVDGLDPAFARRFDLILELPMLPRDQRLRTLNKRCASLISASSRTRIAEYAHLTPAVVSKAFAVIESVESKLRPAQVEAAFELLLSNTLQAEGYKPVSTPHKFGFTAYDPICTNADADLEALAQRLQQTQGARICLYGPSGTGKTAYAHWLAEQLQKPLLLKKASDLMSKYQGETEQNLAKAFRTAALEGAIFLIDEVDSFLQSREGATRSWEVSQVNELLTQLETFNGIFIASTNLMGQLDAAALRRFDLKIRFDYLPPAKAKVLFERCCAELNFVKQASAAPSPKCVPAINDRLHKLGKLTPGDFAAVVRQARLLPIPNAEALINTLEMECALKPEGNCAAMGFLT